MSIITYSVITHSRFCGRRYQLETVLESNRSAPEAVYEYPCNSWAVRHNRLKGISGRMKEVE